MLYKVVSSPRICAIFMLGLSVHTSSNLRQNLLEEPANPVIMEADQDAFTTMTKPGKDSPKCVLQSPQIARSETSRLSKSAVVVCLCCGEQYRALQVLLIPFPFTLASKGKAMTPTMDGADEQGPAVCLSHTFLVHVS